MKDPETSRVVPTIDRNVSDNTPPPSPAANVTQVEVDDSKAVPDYANFCRLSGTPEELLIDFGLNPQSTSMTTHPVAVSQRIITGWHTAKRLLQVLQLTVDRHEAAFGVLETDARKRLGRT